MDGKGKPSALWHSSAAGSSKASAAAAAACPAVRVVRAILRNIPSKAHPGESAGSIVFADSFMLPKAGSSTVGVRVLTASVPYVAVWLGKKEGRLADDMRRAIAGNEKSVAADMGRLIVMRPLTSNLDGVPLGPQMNMPAPGFFV